MGSMISSLTDSAHSLSDYSYFSTAANVNWGVPVGHVDRFFQTSSKEALEAIQLYYHHICTNRVVKY